MASIGALYLALLADMLSTQTATVALAAQGLLVMLATRRYWKTVLGA